MQTERWGGPGGGSDPILISGIWPENEPGAGGLERFSSGEIVRNGAKHP